MNEALDAVRYAHSSAFTSTKGIASNTAKRALLRHLADMANWSCKVAAYLDSRKAPNCDHRGCQWICFQSEVETADEMSMDKSTVKRVRRALVADEWITLTQQNLGRGAITFYTLNKEKLLSFTKQKHQKRCKLPTSLQPPPPVEQKEGSMDLFTSPEAAESVIAKGGNTPPIDSPDKQEGGQYASTKGATRTVKGVNSPSLNQKNPNEPFLEPKTIPMPLTGPSESDLERVYWAFPKHVEKPDAIKAIRAAVKELGTGRERPVCSVPEALEFLYQKATAYAASDEGKAGKFTPKPATWFNKQRYHEDEKEWNHAGNPGAQQPNRGQAREDSIIDTYRRAEAIANNATACVPADGTEGGHGGKGITLVHPRA